MLRLIERVLWAIILSIGISSAVYLINANFEEAASQPILTTIDNVDITSIPFPAVTVIPGKTILLTSLGSIPFHAKPRFTLKEKIPQTLRWMASQSVYSTTPNLKDTKKRTYSGNNIIRTKSFDSERKDEERVNKRGWCPRTGEGQQ